MIERLREPPWRLVRIPAGTALILGGLVGFLPMVGFWMFPLGLAILAIDIPIAGRVLQRLTSMMRWLHEFHRRRTNATGGSSTSFATARARAVN
jgi:hypothetical protein